jgi:hypothetical protein
MLSDLAKEIFAVVKGPVFTTDPLPSDLNFEELSRCVTRIDYGAYPDPEFVCDTLVPHFEASVSMLKSAVIQYTQALKEVQAALRDPPNLLRFPRTFLNSATYRKLRVIAPIYQRHSDALLRVRLSLITRRLSILRNLLKVAEHLSLHPRYLYLNVHYANQPLHLFEFQCMPDVLARSHACRQYVEQLEARLQMVAAPFESREAGLALIRRLIDVNLGLLDPSTNYLPESPEYLIFAHFLASPQSPVRVHYGQLANDSDVVMALQQMVADLAAFVNLLPGSVQRMQVLRGCCARFLFDECLAFDSPTTRYEKLERWLATLAHKEIRSLGVLETQLPEDSLDKTAIELFAESAILQDLPQELLTLHFLNNPIDILYRIHKIELALAAFLAEETSESIRRVKTFDNMFVGWKLLFIAAQIPDPQRIFEFVGKWKKLDCVPHAFVVAYKVPHAVLTSFVSDATKAHV